MPKNVRKIAQSLGAKVVDRLPETGGGAAGMMRLAHEMKKRLEPGKGRRPGRPSDPSWSLQRKVPMSEETYRRLNEIAASVSTPERKVSPMQIAAQLLEERLRTFDDSLGGG
jgi:hypothetical protein